MAENIWSLLGVLAAVAAILALAYWCTRLIGGCGSGSLRSRQERGELAVVGQMNVGRNERLLLIRLGKRCLLLGVANDRITVLTELTGEEAEVWIREPDPEERIPGFVDVLRERIVKKK